MDIVVSDFDNTVFKRNYGLIWPVVEYLEERNCPVYIVTYRSEDQKDFILTTLAGTKIEVMGIGFADSRKKEPQTKLEIVRFLTSKYNIVEALDDDDYVVLGYKDMGINAHRT